MKEALRIILPLYLLAFFVVAFLWRSYLVYKRTGVNPYVVRGDLDRPIDFVGILYRVPAAFLAVTTLAYAFSESVYEFATPIVWLENSAIQIAGLVVMTAGIVWTAIAQKHMGDAWRIGIDAENKTELIERGLFGISRNPIFLGNRVTLFGFFLALPNAMTLAAVLVADVLIQIQVRLEEEFLTGVHGDKYRQFCGRVRRWI